VILLVSNDDYEMDISSLQGQNNQISEIVRAQTNIIQQMSSEIDNMKKNIDIISEEVRLLKNQKKECLLLFSEIHKRFVSIEDEIKIIR
jgi:archaellum component FlaC